MLSRRSPRLTPLLGMVALLLPATPVLAGNFYIGPNASVTYTFNPNQPNSISRVTVHQYPSRYPSANPYPAYPYGIGLYYPGAAVPYYPYVPNSAGFYYGSSPALNQPAPDYFGLGNNYPPAPEPPVPVAPPAPVRMPVAEPTTANVAEFELHLPADARLYILGVKMNQTGAVRHFVSPPLRPGQYYTYELRATFMDNNKEVTTVRTLSVRAGDKLEVLFTALPASGSGSSSSGGATR